MLHSHSEDYRGGNGSLSLVSISMNFRQPIQSQHIQVRGCPVAVVEDGEEDEARRSRSSLPARDASDLI
jgi:hypothetical protein